VLKVHVPLEAQEGQVHYGGFQINNFLGHKHFQYIIALNTEPQNLTSNNNLDFQQYIFSESNQ